MKSLLFSFLVLFGASVHAAPTESQPPKEVVVNFTVYLNTDVCDSLDPRLDCKSGDGDYQNVKIKLEDFGEGFFATNVNLQHEINGIMHTGTIGVSTVVLEDGSLADFLFTVSTKFGEGSDYYAFGSGAVFAKTPQLLNDIFIDINPVQVTGDKAGNYLPYILIGAGSSDVKLLKAKARHLVRAKLRRSVK